MAFEVGFFSDKLWSVAVYADTDNIQLFDFTCQEGNLPSLEDFHKVSLGNIQLLVKVSGCMVMMSMMVHLSTFKSVRIHVLNKALEILALITFGILTVVEIFMHILKCIYNGIVV